MSMDYSLLIDNLFLFFFGYGVSYIAFRLELLGTLAKGKVWTVGMWSTHVKAKVYTSIFFVLLDVLFLHTGITVALTGYIFRCAFVDIPAIDKTIKDHYANQQTR